MKIESKINNNSTRIQEKRINELLDIETQALNYINEYIYNNFNEIDENNELLHNLKGKINTIMDKTL